MGLAFYRRGFKLPTGKNRLLGAGHIQFEVVFHWGTNVQKESGVNDVKILEICSIKTPVPSNKPGCLYFSMSADQKIG